MPAPRGAIRLFQFNGIAVFLHWTWFLVAVYEIGGRKGTYSSIPWNVLEYLALFAIVTLHEFGHAFACRSVGGHANRIMLWPLGGVAYVEPPPRPGATLWSIAAGPLVNFALLPVLGGLALLTSGPSPSDVHALLRAIAYINVGLLLFNLIPVYPLDGGQILRALLWFVIGRTHSLMVTAVIGLAGAAGLAWLALSSQSPWLGIIALFVATQCINSFQVARSLNQWANAPPREGFACPSCKARPPVGPFWACSSCGAPYDIFEPGARASTRSETTTLNLSLAPATASGANPPTQCPNCHEESAAAKCLQCGATGPVTDWRAGGVAVRQDPNVVGVVRARRPRPPSIVLVALGACISVISVLSLLATLLFFSMSSDASTLQSAYLSEIDALWSSAGIAVPGERTVPLKGGTRYDAYVETRATDASKLVAVEVSVRNVDSGQEVAVTRVMDRQRSEYLQRAGRELSPTASFRILASGSYAVRVSTPQTVPDDARVKVGPSIRLVSDAASVLRGVAIGMSMVSMLLVTGALGLFARYRTQRKAFNSALQRFDEGQSPV